MSYINIPAQERLRPKDPGQRIGTLPVNPTASTILAGMVLKIVSVNGIAHLDVYDGTVDLAADIMPVGIAADDYTEAIGTLSYPSGGSKKLTFYHGYGQYLSLTYDDLAATNYTPGKTLYVGTAGKAGLLSEVKPVGGRPIGVVTLAPEKTTAGSAWNNNTNPYKVPATQVEALKGTQFGARAEDAVRVLPNGDRRAFLGFMWIS